MDRHNYGIDLLRIIAMIMIPVLHTLGHGGILGSSAALSVHNETAWFLEIAAYCAVDVYGLISGYVGYGRKQKFSNLFYLYFQVLFYTLSMTVLFFFYRPDSVGVKTVIEAFLPFTYNTYWYFTAYFCLFFFMPFFDHMVDKFEKTMMTKLIFCFFIIFSLLPTVFRCDLGYTGRGYSFLWLAILYIVGAYIKKYGSGLSYANRNNLLVYIVCVVLTLLSKIMIEFLTREIYGEIKYENYLISYTSPTVILCAAALLLFFARLECGRYLVRFVRFFAPASFGVYLFHEEPLFRDTIMNGAFVGYLSFNPLIMGLAVIGTALSIWLAGSFVDKIRAVFFSLLRIRKLCSLIERRISSICTGLRQRAAARGYFLQGDRE